jgi:hypothetical protein
MTAKILFLREWLKTRRFLMVLVALMLLFVIYPVTEGFIGVGFVLDILLSAVLLSGIYAVGEKGKALLVALLTGVPAFLAHWIHFVFKWPALYFIDVSFSTVFFAFATFTIVGHLFKHKRVTSDLIRGAICGYFLVGLMWASFFALIEALHPGSFTCGETTSLDMQDLIYFSFVTLTTTGYGDIAPATGQARALSILEAVMGQMYVAVNIATLVAIRISQSSGKQPE